MSNFGAMILSIFAAIWGISGLYTVHAPTWTLLAPVLVTAGVIVTLRRGGRERVRPAAEMRRIGRVVMWASAAEGVAILVAIKVVTSAGRPDLVVASVAAIVGLHFLPLARAFPAPRYYVTAAALLLVAVVGFTFPSPMMVSVVCGSCAIVLWATAVSIAFDSPRTSLAP
ncbi:MAG: hypothetical protein M3R51_02320 [Candidatus Eremiobacteraeota bacterium]|nr:hypothetical protein [Candidatus Eremiobacteraeota bacterium]